MTIQEYAFRRCEKLKEINISDQVISINDLAFWQCPSLSIINVDENSTYYCCEDNILFNKEKTKIVRYPATKRNEEYIIPNSVIDINLGAFYGCSNLKNITMSKNIKNIENYAFQACTSLTNIIIPEGVAEIKSYTFKGCENLKKIQIPDAVKSIGFEVFYGCSKITIKCNCNSYANRYAQREGILTEIEHYYNIKSTTEAICEQGGKIVYECTNCKDSYEENVPAKGHTEVIDSREEPTCTEKGKTEGKHCSICNKVLVAQEEIPALGHDYESKVIAPTKTEQGYTEHTCSRCKNSYKDNYVPALGEDELVMYINEIENLYEVQHVQGYEYVFVQPGTTQDNLREQIVANREYEILNKEKQVKEKDILATGNVIKFKEKEDVEYIIIVKGDVDGNGIIEFLGDVVLLNNYRLGRIKEISIEAKLAGDIDENGQIDFINDIVKINNYRIGILNQLNK